MPDGDTHTTPTSSSSSRMRTTAVAAAAAASEKRGGPKHQFPDILYNMLELAHASPGSSSDSITGGSNSNFPITWCENGRAFHIIDRVAFEGLLPMYFKTTKLRSFQRQLNLWEFKRIKSGPDKDAYYLEHFIRGHPEYMDKMVRIKIKGNATSSPPCSPPLRSPPAMAYGGDDQHDDVGVESKRGPSTSPSRSKIHMSKGQSYDLHCSMMRLSPNVTNGQQRPPMPMVAMGHRRRSDPTPYVRHNTLACQSNHDNRSALYYPPTANGISASYQLNGYKTGTFQGQEEQRVASNNTFHPSRISTSDMQMQPSNAFSSNAPSSHHHQLNANIRQPSFTQADRVISGKTMDRHFSGELSTELKSRLDVEEEDEFDRYIDNNIHLIG